MLKEFGMSFGKFQIELENQRKVFSPGENVSGNVVIVNDKRIQVQIQGLAVRFLGRATVGWTKSQSQESDDDKDSHYYFNCEINLLGNFVLTPGEHFFPFNFFLPNGLPSSYIGKFGRVEYMVKAIVAKGNDNYSKKERLVHFAVNGILDLNNEFGARQNLLLKEHKTFGWIFHKKEVNFNLRLPRKGFVPGELMPFTVEMSNHSKKKVSNAKVMLIQTVSFQAKSNKYKSRQIKKIIATATGPKIEIGDNELWNDTIEIPEIPPTRFALPQTLNGISSSSSSLIDLQYDLRFEMELSGESKLRGELAIVIGTVPFRNSTTEVSTPHFAAQSLQIENEHINATSTILDTTIIHESEPSSTLTNNHMLNLKECQYPNFSDIIEPPPTYSEAMSLEPIKPIETTTSKSHPFLEFTNEKL